LKLTIVKGGGIAGVVTRTELASDALSPDDAAQLRDKVADSGVLEATTPETRERSMPDAQQYELTVEQDDGTHSVRLGEAELPDSVRSLIAFAESHPKREETIERAGS
jgi:hypothetical protein